MFERGGFAVCLWRKLFVTGGGRTGFALQFECHGMRVLPAFPQAIPEFLAKNPHFYSVFCDFSLRSTFSLAIVRNGPSFSAAKQG
jgi:hypothetical protein